MSRYRRRKLIRAGWLLVSIFDRTSAAFRFFFGSFWRIFWTVLVCWAAYGLYSFTMFNIRMGDTATPEEVRHYLTSNDPRTNVCMVELIPKRMVNNEPATIHVLTTAVKDCKEAIEKFDKQAAQKAVIKSLEAKK